MSEVNKIEVADYSAQVDENGKPTGALVYVQQKTLEDVESQLKDYLWSLHIEQWGGDALIHCLSLSTNQALLEKGLFPEGQPIVAFRQGVLDYVYIDVLVYSGEFGTYTPVFSLMYGSCDTATWDVMRYILQTFRGY